MDITNTYKVILYIGSLLRCSFYHVDAVDGILFQVPEMVEWSKADQTCQKNNGTLFKPNETSFDVHLFRKCNFNDDLWVAANYITIASVVSASSSDSFIRCEMCNVEKSCEYTCLYKACWNRCRILCVGLFDPHIPSVSLYRHNWTEAKQWCSERWSEFGDKFQTIKYLSSNRNYYRGCFWTGNVIRVQLQTVIARAKEPAECGILHNGTISFTNCTRHLQPLCERVTMTALETPRHYFSEENYSCVFMNTKIRPVATNIEKRTTIVIKGENPSLLLPVGVTPSKNDLEDSPKKSDTGIIIGAVVASVVFLMLTVLGIICVRRKLLKRTFHSKQESKHMSMPKTDATHKTISHYQRQDVPLESEYGLTPFAELESKCEESRSDIVGPKSNPGKYAFTIAPEGNNFNYATVGKNVNVNYSNLTYQINDDTYDHLNDIQQIRYANVTGNLYHTTNFDQINDSTYAISDEGGVGMYDRVNTTICSEYETTDDLRRDSNAAYDHI